MLEVSHLYSVSKPPQKFSDIFPKRLGIFSPNFTCLLNVPATQDYTFLFNYLQVWRSYAILRATSINVLKMSTINLNARWVVVLNMA